ncbi:MAG: flagellar assembly protein FliW [Eubacteriales bacterium]
MHILTKYLGEIEIYDRDIIHFNMGLMGFEDCKEFILLDLPENPHFKILQDIHEAYIGFLLIRPWDFFEDYDIEIPDKDLLKILIQNKEELAIYNIVTLGTSFYDSTINLIAPVVINTKEKLGQQFIINDCNYTTKHPLPLVKQGG